MYINTDPGRNRYIGSCRMGTKSVVSQLIRFGRIMLSDSAAIRFFPSVSINRIPQVPIRFIYPEPIRSDLRIRLLSTRSRRIWCQETAGIRSSYVTGFYNKSVQLQLSETVGLCMNPSNPHIGFVWLNQQRSDRIQLRYYVGNSQKTIHAA